MQAQTKCLYFNIYNNILCSICLLYHEGDGYDKMFVHCSQNGGGNHNNTFIVQSTLTRKHLFELKTKLLYFSIIYAICMIPQ